MRGALSSYQFNSISAVLRWALRVRMDAYMGGFMKTLAVRCASHFFFIGNTLNVMPT